MVIKGLLATWAHHVNYSYYTTKSNVAQHTLSDVRDNNTYTVRKLADGNCWMSENLRLNGGTTITPANSDVSSNFTLATAQTIGATVWSGDTNHVYSTGDFRL